jgi:predicted kinase
MRAGLPHAFSLSKGLMNTLYLTCGLPGSGKTTIAKLIEQQTFALRLTGDEWMHRLYPGISTPDAEMGPNRSRVESLQWQIALRALTLGCTVVVDWGVWSKAERDTCRIKARATGAQVILCLLDPPFEELWKRLAKRNAQLPESTFSILREDLLKWQKLFERPNSVELAKYDPPPPFLAAALSS